MNADILVHIREAFEIRQRTALYLLLGIIEVVGIGVLVAGRTGRLNALVAVSLALVLVPVSIRWPLVPLLGFAAIVPMEEVLRISDIGTLSKVMGLLFAVVYGIPRLGRLRLSAMPKAAYAYIAWAVLSVGWAIDPSAYFGEISTLVQLFAISVLVADLVAHRPGVVRPLMWAYSLGAAVTALIGIDAYLAGAVASGQRVTAFADQDAGQFALLLLPALIFVLHELLAGRLVIPSAMVGGLTGIAIVLSGTRGAWLGFALVVLFFVLPRFGLLRGVLAVGLIGIVLTLAVQLPGVEDLVLQRTQLAVSTGGAGRTDIWTVGLQIFESSPLVGVGYANFPIAYTPELVAKADISNHIGPAFGSHSIIVGTFGELGIIGAACLLLFLGPLLVRPGWGPDGAAVRATLVAMITACLFIDALNRKQVWLVIGIAAGLAYVRRQQTPVTSPDSNPESGSAAWIAAPRPQRRESPLGKPVPLGRAGLRAPGRIS